MNYLLTATLCLFFIFTKAMDTTPSAQELLLEQASTFEKWAFWLSQKRDNNRGIKKTFSYDQSAIKGSYLISQKPKESLFKRAKAELEMRPELQGLPTVLQHAPDQLDGIVLSNDQSLLITKHKQELYLWDTQTFLLLGRVATSVQSESFTSGNAYAFITMDGTQCGIICFGDRRHRTRVFCCSISEEIQGEG